MELEHEMETMLVRHKHAATAAVAERERLQQTSTTTDALRAVQLVAAQTDKLRLEQEMAELRALHEREAAVVEAERSIAGRKDVVSKEEMKELEVLRAMRKTSSWKRFEEAENAAGRDNGVANGAAGGASYTDNNDVDYTSSSYDDEEDDNDTSPLPPPSMPLSVLVTDGGDRTAEIGMDRLDESSQLNFYNNGGAGVVLSRRGGRGGGRGRGRRGRGEGRGRDGGREGKGVGRRTNASVSSSTTGMVTFVESGLKDTSTTYRGEQVATHNDTAITGNTTTRGIDFSAFVDSGTKKAKAGAAAADYR